MPLGGSGSLYTYEITFVPAGCKTYNLGDTLRLQVIGPPPSSVMLNYGEACDGIVATLVV